MVLAWLAHCSLSRCPSCPCLHGHARAPPPSPSPTQTHTTRACTHTNTHTLTRTHTHAQVHPGHHRCLWVWPGVQRPEGWRERHLQGEPRRPPAVCRPSAIHCQLIIHSHWPSAFLGLAWGLAGAAPAEPLARDSSLVPSA